MSLIELFGAKTPPVSVGPKIDMLSLFAIL